MRQLLIYCMMATAILLTSCGPKITGPLTADMTELIPEPPTTIFHNQHRHWAYVTSVYDGDTVTLLFESGVNSWQVWRTRLIGIDAPEVRGREKELGIVTRNWLSDKILGQWILFDTQGWDLDKYGRLLVTLQLPSETNIEQPLNLNQEMIRLGLVQVYAKGNHTIKPNDNDN